MEKQNTYNEIQEQIENQESITIGGSGQFYEIFQRFLRNKTAVVGLVIIVILVICALFPSQLTSPDYAEQDLSNTFQRPSRSNPLGTDEFGRDLLTRIVWGARTSMTIGVAAVLIACLLGVFIGIIAGYYSGMIDNILMRFIDVILAIPNTLLGISIVAALGNSIPVLTLAIGLGAMPPFARVTRSTVLTVRGREYIEAARATGASDARIMLKYILPNSLSPIIVQFSMGVAQAILTISGLSFIGLGVPAPTPEWGSMLSSARNYIRDHWHLVTFPGLAIMITVFAFNSLGDGIRDALDPKLKQ